MENKITLNNGQTLTFGKVKAWDFSVLLKKELGSALADADPLEASLFLTYRAAVVGGFKGSFEDFGNVIDAEEINKVTEVARPFFSMGQDSTKEES